METYSAVVTTGIYCLPPCGGRPAPSNVREYSLAAAAEADGFRSCLRCRPYRSPEALSWTGPEVVCRAVQLIVDGALDGRTESELARRLGVSARHLTRLFASHLGLSPDQLARSRRAHFARRLLDDTDMAIVDVAMASGFGSVRQFNRTCREIFGATPRDLRGRRRVTDRIVDGTGLLLRLPFRGELDWDAIIAYFAARATPGVESVEGSTYRRTVTVGGDPGVIELSRAGTGHLLLRAHLQHWENLIHIVQRVRSIAGLDLDLEEPLAVLGRDPILGPLVNGRPGLRTPGGWDAFAAGVRTIVGQQVSVARATAVSGQLVAALGTPIEAALPAGLTHLFPSPETIAEAGMESVGLTRARKEALRAFARAVADGEVRLDRSIGLDDLVASITALRGLGPWTAHCIAWRIGEPDAFPETDLGIRRALKRHPSQSPALQWRPWRSLATTHLWAAPPG